MTCHKGAAVGAVIGCFRAVGSRFTNAAARATRCMILSSTAHMNADWQGHATLAPNPISCSPPCLGAEHPRGMVGVGQHGHVLALGRAQHVVAQLLACGKQKVPQPQRVRHSTANLQKQTASQVSHASKALPCPPTQVLCGLGALVNRLRLLKAAVEEALAIVGPRDALPASGGKPQAPA